MKRREYRRILWEDLELYEAKGWQAVTHLGIPIAETAGGTLLVCLVFREAP